MKLVRESLSPSESLYGFGGWLTTREEPITIGRKYDAGIVAELIDEFIQKQKLKKPKEHWERALISMNEKWSPDDKKDVKGKVERSEKLSKEMKDAINPLITSNSEYREGKVFRLKYPHSKGCSLGADKDGFFVFTHRARSKSKPTIDKIPQKDIKFIESTG